MILATVGTQLPFDRLISTVDQWAGERNRGDVFAQIGVSKHTPRHLRWSRFFKPDEFQQQLNEASVVVAHAGIGSILSALELGKPVVVFPRLARFGEHRNDHQLATARRFQAMGLVSVAFDEEELKRQLDELSVDRRGEVLESGASAELINRVREFISNAALETGSAR